MSDALEKFVLQYHVDMKDAIERLETLQNKISKTNKGVANAGGEFKKFGREAFAEVSKLTPELGAATSMALRLGTGLLGVGAALGAIAIGVKAINDLRKEYDAQRSLSFASGLSTQEIEQFQRTSASASRLNAGQSRDLIGKLSGMSMSAYTNVDPMSREQLQLRQLGTSAFESNGRIKETSKLIDEISKKFQSVSKERAYALGQSAGLTHDEVDAIRNRNRAMIESTKMSEKEKALQQEAAIQLDKFNQSYNQLTDALRRSGNVIGANLMPYLTQFINWVTDIAEKAPKFFTEVFDELKAQTKASIKTMFEFDNYNEKFDAELEKQRQIIKEDHEKRAKLQNNSAAAAREWQAKFSRDINLFAAAVSTFAGVIDERQAWAAWAGEVGRAAGVGPQAGGGASATGMHRGSAVVGTSVAPAEYDRIIESAAKKWGVDANIMKKMIQVESGYNPNAVSEAGAVGLGQIMPSNFKSLGITNPYDPEQNIGGMAQLLAEYQRASGGDARKMLMMYHGGYKTSGWGARTRSYPDKVLNAKVNYGGGNTSAPPGFEVPVANLGDRDYSSVDYGTKYAPVRGDTRDDVQKRKIQDAIAKALNVPIEQLQLGGVSQGDVHFTRAKLESQQIREVQQKQLTYTAPGIRPMEKAAAYQQYLEAANNLRALQKFGRQVELQSRPGGRDITLQEKAIFIQVDGAQNPDATAQEVVRKLYSVDLNDIVNGSASAIKY